MEFLKTSDIAIMAVGSLLLLFWLVLFFKSAKYTELFSTLDEKEYPLKDLYGTGYALMEMFHYSYKSNRDRKMRNELSVLYDAKFTEYYLRVIYAQSISLALLVAMFAFILYGFSCEVGILFIFLMLSGLCVYYYMTLSTEKIQKRSDEMLSDFSEVVSKLALLTNAGMIMREAWEEVAYTNDRTIYREMRKACDQMSNGIPETEAIRVFGVRCVIPEIKKFSSTIIQGLEKGNSELSAMLQAQSNEVWGMKQQLVRRKGAQANTKLMMPMFLMFIGILIMIVVPIFTNLGV